MTQINIITYHYVRPIKDSPYPNIKGLELSGFKHQLDYLQDNFNIIRMEDLIAASKNITTIPQDACLLTFDDGYKDHHEYVLPELLKRGLQGSFFPPARVLLENILLDVNALHYVLASQKESDDLLIELINECKDFGFTDSDIDLLWEKIAHPNQYDSATIIFIKRMLQRELPNEIRSVITKNLFKKYMGESEAQFCKKLYMSIDETKELIDEGMFVGSHGYRHEWLNTLDYHQQTQEIDKSLDFLSSIGAPTEDWVICYPYGGYNEDTLEILSTRKCALGLTIKSGLADLRAQHKLELHRWDTNDFPQNSGIL